MVELIEPELTEQALEDALNLLLSEELIALKPSHMFVAPRWVRYIMRVRNENWGRSAYLRRRRGWAPK